MYGFALLSRLLLTSLALLPGGMRAQTAVPPTAQAPNVAASQPTVVIGADHRVTFQLYAPQAQAVTVNGDFLMGAPVAHLSKGSDGLWTYTTSPLSPDSYTYNFTVDGVMALDTHNQNFRDSPNALFNFFDMPGPETEFMAMRDVPHGRVEAVVYHSKTLNQERRAHVYLPPHFESIPGKLPVLYLLHGFGDNDISFTSAGKVNLILDNLYAAGKVKNMIVVMPDGHVAGQQRRVFTVGVDDAFSRDFLSDLVPFVQATYPVSTRREDTAIAGFSMGGGQTLNLALWHPETFGYVFPISTGYFPEGAKALDSEHSAVLENVAKHPFRQFIFGKGKDDKLVAANEAATLELMDKYHIPHQYRELDGAHSFVFSRRFLLSVFPLMFQ